MTAFSINNLVVIKTLCTERGILPTKYERQNEMPRDKMGLGLGLRIGLGVVYWHFVAVAFCRTPVQQLWLLAQ